MADILVKKSPLRAITLTEEDIPSMIDELPLVALLCAFADGESRITGARELRVKESDRISTTVQNLRAMGAEVEEFEDGMVIHGGKPLHGAVMDSYGDHRIAMSFLMAGLRAEGSTTLLHCTNINTSYPGFKEHLLQLIS